MKRRACAAEVVVLATMLAWAAEAQTPGKWVKLAAFPEPAEEVYGATAGGKMYVLGGLAPGWKPRGLVFEYDPATNAWTKKKPMPLAAHHLAVVEFNGKIYVFGGFVPPTSGPPAWVPIDNAWEYDPANDSWKALAPMPTKRGSPVAAAVAGKIYVIGGGTTSPGSKEPSLHPARPHLAVGIVEEYDPATNNWRPRTPMPTHRNHAGVGVVGGKIYVIGGRTGAAFISVGSNTDVVEEYNPATDTWGPPKARMPTPRSAVAYATYKDRIYIAGGEFQNEKLMAAFWVVEAYHPASNSWSTLPRMPIPRHGLAVAVIGNHLHLVSGEIQSAGIPGAHLASESHDAFEIPDQ